VLNRWCLGEFEVVEPKQGSFGRNREDQSPRRIAKAGQIKQFARKAQGCQFFGEAAAREAVRAIEARTAAERLLA